MSIYSELLRIGMPETEASAIAEAVQTFHAEGLVTKQYFDLKLAQFESRLAWRIGTLIVTAMVGLTGIFALIVGWLVTRTS